MKNLLTNSSFQYTGKELLGLFPETKEIISQKIKESKLEMKSILKIANEMYELIGVKVKDKFSNWFWKTTVNWIYGVKSPRYLEIKKHMKMLYGQIDLFNNHSKNTSGKILDETKQKALSVPIETLVPESTKLRRSGSNLVGLCCFHQEKHPSFYIYTNNRFHCFGCGASGDVIDFIKRLYNFSFRETINYLIGGKRDE